MPCHWSSEPAFPSSASDFSNVLDPDPILSTDLITSTDTTVKLFGLISRQLFNVNTCFCQLIHNYIHSSFTNPSNPQVSRKIPPPLTPCTECGNGVNVQYGAPGVLIDLHSYILYNPFFCYHWGFMPVVHLSV